MADYPRVQGVVLQEGQEITGYVNATAERYSFPPRLLVALGIAESGLRAVADREVSPEDTSYGPWQQTVRWAKGYGLGDGSDTPENRAFVRQVLTTDLATAADIAGQQLGRFWQQYHDPIEALCRYNKPALPAGQNPHWLNYSRAWATSARYLAEEQPMPDVYTPHVDHDRGTVAGTFAHTPAGIILHGSRSGIAGRGVAAEYDGTRAYAASGIELGWSATVGEDAISLHMSPREWGWNAREASHEYLGVELAQPTVDDPITDGQVRALCWWLLNEVAPAWPDLDMTSLPTHAELPAGIRDGKSDCFPRFDARADELRTRIADELARQQGDEPAPENGDEDLSAEERAELTDLRNLIGNINGNADTPGWIDAVSSAVTGAKTERLKKPRNALLDAALAACATIKRGGPPED